MSDREWCDYAARCSAKTLQSNDEGFFLAFADNLAKIAGPAWITKKFGKSSSDEEKIAALLENNEIKAPLNEILGNIQELYRKKSSEVARQRRIEAERHLKSNELQKSLSLYSQSVLRAEQTGRNSEIDQGCTLALALLGRSQVLIKLGKLDYALNDIRLALNEKLPNEHRAQAYWNSSVCYDALGEQQKSKLALDVANKLGTYDRIESGSKVTEKEILVPQLSYKENPQLPNAIYKLKVQTSPAMGRFLVCNQQIDIGETLVAEPPSAACLNPDRFGTHCQNCFKRLTAPVWCPDCSNVAFCGTDCRTDGLRAFHAIECKLSELLRGTGVSVLCDLALRLVTRRPYLENIKHHNEPIFNLCTNRDKRKPLDSFRRAIMAVFLLRCLQKTSYFPDEADRVLEFTRNATKIAETLLFHLQMLQFNAHEIYEKNNNRVSYIGVGIYPTVALFNHQCYPTVTRYFVGKSIVIVSTKPLERGELVAENYGPIFARKSLNERKHYLNSRYWFDCECRACLENWPVFSYSRNVETKRIRCPTEHCPKLFGAAAATGADIKCSECNRTVCLKGNLQTLERCEARLRNAVESTTTERFSLLKNALRDFHRVSAQPNELAHTAEEALRACYSDYGNKYQS